MLFTNMNIIHFCMNLLTCTHNYKKRTIYTLCLFVTKNNGANLDGRLPEKDVYLTWAVLTSNLFPTTYIKYKIIY